MMSWNELSNALSFGGSRKRKKKVEPAPWDDEEQWVMTTQMNTREIAELVRYWPDDMKTKFIELRNEYRAEYGGTGSYHKAFFDVCKERHGGN